MRKRSKLQKKIQMSTNHQTKENVLNQIKEIENNLIISINTERNLRETRAIIIIIQKDRQCKAGRGRLTPYHSEDRSPTLPTYRGKEEKGKIVEDKKGECN